MKAKGEESEEDGIELFEAGEDAGVAFHTSKEAFDLIAFPGESAVVAPRIDAIGFGRDHRNHA
jgi:hypothetical protein